MTTLAEHEDLLETECSGLSLSDRADLLESQAEELTAQAKSVRVLDWTVRSLCDPKSLVH